LLGAGNLTLTKKIARIDFFISKEAITKWKYCEKRKPGGKRMQGN